jgi:hypothetical protein
MTNSIIKPKTAAERMDDLARMAAVPHLKYTTGVWTYAGNPVAADARFVCDPNKIVHSWIHWLNGNVAQEIEAELFKDQDGDAKAQIVAGKSRDDLGNHDEAAWELDNAGNRKDPWVYGLSLPMMNAKTGALGVYKTSSRGGMSAIAGLVAGYGCNSRFGFPIVELGTDSYKNKRHGGYTSIPLLTVVGYDTPPNSNSNGGNGDGGGGNGEGAHVIGHANVIESDHAIRVDRELDDVQG